jgi:hypothetical protein
MYFIFLDYIDSCFRIASKMPKAAIASGSGSRKIGCGPTKADRRKLEVGWNGG